MVKTLLATFWKCSAASLVVAVPAQILFLSCLCSMGQVKIGAALSADLIIGLGIAARSKRASGWPFASFYSLLPWLLIPGIIAAERLVRMH